MEKLNVHLVKLCLEVLLLSVYSPFSDGVGFPLHNMPSPFIYVMGIFLSISSSAISIILYSLTMSFWYSNRSSAFNSKLHILLYPVLITCPYHLSLPLLMTVTSLHPPLGPHLDQLPGLSRHIPTPEAVGYPRQVTTHTTAPLVNQVFTYCALNRVCL